MSSLHCDTPKCLHLSSATQPWREKVQPQIPAIQDTEISEVIHSTSCRLHSSIAQVSFKIHHCYRNKVAISSIWYTAHLCGNWQMPLPALLITFQFHLVVTFLYMEAQWPCSLLNTADNLFGWLLTCEPRLLFLRALQNQLRNIKTIATVKDFTQPY